MSDPQAQLRRLSDLSEIVELKGRFGLVADRCVQEGAAAAEDYVALCAEDVVMQFSPTLVFRGHDGIRQLAVSTHAQWTCHNFFNPLIRIDGDVATGRWMGLTQILPTSGDAVRQSMGFHDDVYVRTPAGWRLKQVMLTSRPSA